LFGSVFGRAMSEAGRRVLIIDQRDHIGGNVYTREVDGVQVHVYGPHIFHTDSEPVWRYVNRFARFNHYVHHPLVRYEDRIYSFPINLMTLQQLWGVTSPAEAEQKLAEVRIHCEHPRNLEEWILSQVGEQIYRTFVHGYTKKQWGREPRELPASIIRRLPIRLTFDNNYYTHRFQGIPIDGYTRMMENILDGIDLELSTPHTELGEWRRYARKLVFTGSIDEFLDYRFGDLEYRSLRFESEVRAGDFQGAAQVNYGDEEIPFTRIVEHKHFVFGTNEKTVITREYPVEWDREKVRYYPINDERNSALYRRYLGEARRLDDVILGGRLASYRYYDMHQVIGSALAAASKELGQRQES
jgi:UDP-galactopyranose mutase